MVRVNQTHLAVQNMRFPQRPCKSLITGKCANESPDRNFDKKQYTNIIRIGTGRSKISQLALTALRGNRTPGGSMATTQVTTTPLMRYTNSGMTLCVLVLMLGFEAGETSKLRDIVGPISTPYLYRDKRIDNIVHQESRPMTSTSSLQPSQCLLAQQRLVLQRRVFSSS